MKVTVKSARCKECGLCYSFCPKEAISFSQDTNASGYHPVMVDDEKCIGCGTCYITCPDGVFHVLKSERGVL